jgi:4-hydroxybenzoate polyprenyltransferase
MLQKLKYYALLMRFHKPIGILLLLWPALWALWLADNGKPDLFVVTIFIYGVIVMRAAGCIINDIADRHLDGHVQRTRDRPLASGKVSVREALVLFSFLMLMALVLVLQLNLLTFYLAIAGAILAVIYPFLKRITHLPQLGLGAAFSWSIPMAFAAETNHVPPTAWLLFFTALLWTVFYDTMYAMADRTDDLKIGVKSTAILFGRHDKIILGILQLFFLLGLSLVGYYFRLTPIYYFCVALSALFLIFQQFLLKDRVPTRSLQAFLNNKWVGLIIFVGIAGSYAT